GSNNVLAIGLEDKVYLWDAANESTKLLQPVEDRGPITCIVGRPIRCSSCCRRFGNSDLSPIDPATGHVVDGMEDENQCPVLSLVWRSNSILTTEDLMALLLIMTLERMTCSSISIMGIGVEFVVLNGPCCRGGI
ncbi:unnamed protein product, partial [Musa acuminata var. zebrina]